MTIEFTVKKETQLSHRFCRYVIRWLGKELRSKRGRRSMQLRLDLLHNADWIRWTTGRPGMLTSETLINEVIASIRYTIRKNTFIIYMDENRLYPGTTTPVERIMRFVDYGNELVKGTMFFASQFLKYQKSIYDYWYAFKVAAQSR